MTVLIIILLVYIGCVLISFLNLYLEWTRHDKTGKYLRDLFEYHGAFISICMFIPLINIAFILDLLIELILFISKYIRIRL